MKNSQSTREKLAVLKDLQQGKISALDLIKETVCHWYCEDGIYHHGNLVLSRSEFEAYIAKRPKQKNIVWKAIEGCDPLIED